MEKEKAVLVSGVKQQTPHGAKCFGAYVLSSLSLSPSSTHAQAASRHRWKQPCKLLDSGGPGALFALKIWEQPN